MSKKVRVTGKLLRSDDGKGFACRECDNSDYPDDTIILETVDTEYVYPLNYVLNQIEKGELEVVRDLHNKKYPFQKHRVVHSTI